MTSIAKCGGPVSPHLIYTINGVGTCYNCGDMFIDRTKVTGLSSEHPTSQRTSSEEVSE